MTNTTKYVAKRSRKKKSILPWIVSALSIGFTIGIYCHSGWDSIHTSKSKILPLEANNIELCFTPPSGCGEVIRKQIATAEDSIYMQAYGITAAPIVDELIQAHQRGVEVKILLDKSNRTDKWSRIVELQSSGIDVSIDKVPGIAHNKVMIIDANKVITGSYNFTNSADTRNVENVLIINNEEIATEYLNFWQSRYLANHKEEIK